MTLGSPQGPNESRRVRFASSSMAGRFGCFDEPSGIHVGGGGDVAFE